MSESAGTVALGSDERSVSHVVEEAFQRAPGYLDLLFASEQFSYFCRPIYIGIAKNLRERIYAQHYVSLIDYWDDSGSVARYLNAHNHATVQTLMDKLDLPHSFSLEARALGVAPRDLMVSIFPTVNFPETIGPDVEADNGNVTRRALERLLQLLADPVCGRR